MESKKQVLTMAFSTSEDHNRLSEDQKLDLVTESTKAMGGVTLTEHIGGYTMDNGSLAIEYSYSLEFFGASKAAVKNFGLKLGRKNAQESILLDGSLVYC